MNDQLLRNFSICYPKVTERITAHYYNDQIHEIIFILDNDRVGYYDENENIVHYIFKNRNDISNEEYKKEFSRRLSKLIWYKTTQIELAKVSGITQHMISKYATGKSVPTLVNIIKLANALDCPIDMLMFEFERRATK